MQLGGISMGVEKEIVIINKGFDIKNEILKKRSKSVLDKKGGKK